jgi:hypothetical protein
VIAAEGAACLLAAGPPGSARSGVLAPAQAFPAADFLDRLGAYGIEWSTS